MKTLSINYKKFTGVFTKKGKDGKTYIAFPADENGVVIHEKGFFHNCTLTESNQEYSDHFLKTNFEKERYSKLTDEQKMAIPIIGNAILNYKDKDNVSNDSPEDDCPI